MVDRLLRGHGDFQKEYVRNEGEFLRRLASEGQSPDALYVGCADSRVVPELLTASSPGRLFVVRNIANMVPPLEHADASVGAAIEYAVGVLEVPHFIVCGHYGCGGVEAMLDGGESVKAFPSLHEWLSTMAPAVEAARVPDHATWWRRAVERNVVMQLVQISSFPVAKQALDSGRLVLHGWVYDIEQLTLQVYDAQANAFLPASAVADD